MSTMDFNDLRADPPRIDEVGREYHEIAAAFDAADEVGQRIEAIRRWNECRIRHDTWGALTGLHYNQDTRNEEYRKAREHRDGMVPKLTELDVAFKRKLLESTHREELTARLGAHLFNLWEADVAAFDPAIEGDRAKESQEAADYTALRASARIEYQG
ncbi:MAG: hypothetical protein ACYSX0_22545 [Planctomycetota bacterium]|jgi:hypothetical protein